MATHPITDRQRRLLQRMAQGEVLRRLKGKRTYGLVKAEAHTNPVYSGFLVNSGHVLRLQGLYLTAHDLVTGVEVPGASAFGRRDLEFRLKEGAVIPCA